MSKVFLFNIQLITVISFSSVQVSDLWKTFIWADIELEWAIDLPERIFKKSYITKRIFRRPSWQQRNNFHSKSERKWVLSKEDKEVPFVATSILAPTNNETKNKLNLKFLCLLSNKLGPWSSKQFTFVRESSTPNWSTTQEFSAVQSHALGASQVHGDQSFVQ